MASHPGYLAALTRCSSERSVTPEERDRLLRVLFPEMVKTPKDYEAMMQVLREADDLHRSGEAYAATAVLQSVVDEHQQLRRIKP